MSQSDFCMLIANMYISGQSNVPDLVKAIFMIFWIALGLFNHWKGI